MYFYSLLFFSSLARRRYLLPILLILAEYLFVLMPSQECGISAHTSDIFYECQKLLAWFLIKKKSIVGRKLEHGSWSSR